jgi:hypothetical protein
MSKERNNARELQKKPAMTLKEKRAAKKEKKGNKTDFSISDKK